MLTDVYIHVLFETHVSLFWHKRWLPALQVQRKFNPHFPSWAAHNWCYWDQAKNTRYTVDRSFSVIKENEYSTTSIKTERCQHLHTKATVSNQAQQTWLPCIVMSLWGTPQTYLTINLWVLDAYRVLEKLQLSSGTRWTVAQT